jgi:hypothetical protein
MVQQGEFYKKLSSRGTRDVAPYGERKILDSIGRMSAQPQTMHDKTWTTYDDRLNKTNALPSSDRPTVIRSRRELRSGRVVTDFRWDGLFRRDLEKGLWAKPLKSPEHNSSWNRPRWSR